MITGINGSRSAEWRSQMRQNSKGPGNALAYMDPNREVREGEVRQIGNQKTFNIEDILAKNLLASEYLKSLVDKTFDELVDEIYERVKDTDPWLSGVPGRMPSTFFTVMFRLQMMHLTEDEIQKLLDHPDSPYIRCTGFLYLRYTCPFEDLIKWFGPYFSDPEMFNFTKQSSDFAQKRLGLSTGARRGDGRLISIGKFVRMLVTEGRYCGSLLPRIPTAHLRVLQEAVKEAEEEERRAGANRVDRVLEPGTKVEGKFAEDGKWYPGKIESRDATTGRYWVLYDEPYGNTELLPFPTAIRVVDNRGKTSAGASSTRRSRSRSRDRVRTAKSHDRRSSRSRSRDRAHRDGNSSKHRSSSRHRSRSKRRSSSRRSRSRSRGRSRRSGSRHRRSSSRSRHRSSARHDDGRGRRSHDRGRERPSDRDRDRTRDRGRGHRHDRHSSGAHRRSTSRDRGRSR